MIWTGSARRLAVRSPTCWKPSPRTSRPVRGRMRPTGGWSVDSRSAAASAGLPVPSPDAAPAPARALLAGACHRTDQAWRNPVMASPVSPATSSVGSCTRCYGWGRPGGDGVCAACAAWLPRGRRDGCCRRCRHVSRLNRDALCRPCILEVRSADLEWVIADLERCTHHLQPRGHQLVLLLDGVKLAAGQPSRKRDQRPQRVRLDRRPAWLRDRLSMPEPADDPDIWCCCACPGRSSSGTPGGSVTAPSLTCRRGAGDRGGGGRAWPGCCLAPGGGQHGAACPCGP